MNRKKTLLVQKYEPPSAMVLTPKSKKSKNVPIEPILESSCCRVRLWLKAWIFSLDTGTESMYASNHSLSATIIIPIVQQTS